MASGFLGVEEEGLADGVCWGLRSLRPSPSLTWVELGICWEVELEAALGFFLSDRIGELEADRGLLVLDPSESDFLEEEKKSLFLNTIALLLYP